MTIPLILGMDEVVEYFLPSIEVELYLLVRTGCANI